MKKRITDNTCNHGFAIGQIVKVDKIDDDGDYWSGDWFLDNDDCEDFDDYKPGDKVRLKQDTYNHGLTDKLATIKHSTEGYCVDGSRSYKTEEGMFVPERDFDCYEGETYVNKKETKTMKYKEGDKVKIAACKSGHEFDIGSEVKIEKVYNPGQENENYDVTDGEQIWGVVGDEIAPIPETTLITRPHDYTGCDPEIAEALKQGLDVYCEVWDSVDSGEYNSKGWICACQLGTEYPYRSDCSWKHARPIRQELKPKTKLVPKPASEIFAWLENPENGYKQTKDGKFWEKENQPTFTEKMVKYCGKDSLAGYDWHPEWLRQAPDEEQVSESSENLHQTATVLKHRTAHLHPNYKVTIIRQDEDGDYLCESESGIRVWMQPHQLKFD